MVVSYESVDIFCHLRDHYLNKIPPLWPESQKVLGLNHFILYCHK